MSLEYTLSESTHVGTETTTQQKNAIINALVQAVLGMEGGGGGDLEGRVADLEADLSDVINQVNDLSARVAALENPGG